MYAGGNRNEELEESWNYAIRALKKVKNTRV